MPQRSRLLCLLLTFIDCQNDFAYNILVNPSGDQVLCSDTNLTPDDTNMLSTW